MHTNLLQFSWRRACRIKNLATNTLHLLSLCQRISLLFVHIHCSCSFVFSISLALGPFLGHCAPRSAGPVVALCKLTAEVEIRRVDFPGLIFTRISQRRTAFNGTPLKEHKDRHRIYQRRDIFTRSNITTR